MSRFNFAGSKTNEIAFPLGGIGAGCISLAGNGRLIDWEIFNRPAKGTWNGLSHFAVRAEQDGKVLDARILNGDLHPPYVGELAQKHYSGSGWGPKRENLCGMPHFREHAFEGKYPFAKLTLGGEGTFPGEAALRAFNPLIPSNDRDSSIPAALFEVELTNTTGTAIDYTVIGALANPLEGKHAEHRVEQADGRTQLLIGDTELDPESDEYGQLAISTDADDVSFQQYWFRGAWCDSLEIYWQDVLAGGRFENRVYEPGRAGGYSSQDTGHLAAHVTVPAGGSRRVRFVITWHVPNCRNYWNGRIDELAAEVGLANRWKNYYATQWADAQASGRYVLDNWDRLETDSQRFADTLFGSTLPEVAIDAAAACLSVLKTCTCVRVEDGTFYGWEGTGCTGGCCAGSCTHVWNYAQGLAFLFPSLERSMRQANYDYNVDENGGSRFRIELPLGVPAKAGKHRPCADGQFGDVVKTYRDWKLSGKTDWLRGLWPAIRRTIEYAWSPANFDRWDPDKTGVLHGRQHHTLDMELFGPNAWLTGYYLAALKAAAEMADVCDAADFAAECRAIFAKGKAWADEHLFNGEYYSQTVDLTDKAMLEQFNQPCGDGCCAGPGKDAVASYWSDELGQIKYQIGQGCEIDMVIAQWHANLYGLGEIYDGAQVRSALAATYKYSYTPAMRELANPWRVYTLNDEAGLLICSFPNHVERPRIPLPYTQETQGGFEYAAATHMIQAGLIDEGLTTVQAIRDRYDGENRNPWDEIECGHHYARTLAAWSLVNTFSGFSFDLTAGQIGFAPLQPGDEFRCVWSVDGAWGQFTLSSGRVELRVLYGQVELRKLTLPITPSTAEARGNAIEIAVADDAVSFTPITLAAGEALVLCE